jgi:hypothetical protein
MSTVYVCIPAGMPGSDPIFGLTLPGCRRWPAQLETAEWCQFGHSGGDRQQLSDRLLVDVADIGGGFRGQWLWQLTSCRVASLRKHFDTELFADGKDFFED